MRVDCATSVATIGALSHAVKYVLRDSIRFGEQCNQYWIATRDAQSHWPDRNAPTETRIADGVTISNRRAKDKYLGYGMLVAVGRATEIAQQNRARKWIWSGGLSGLETAKRRDPIRSDPPTHASTWPMLDAIGDVSAGHKTRAVRGQPTARLCVCAADGSVLGCYEALGR